MEKVIETPEFILSMPWRWRRNFSPRYHYNFKKKAKKRKEKKRKIWSGRFCWINHLFRDLVIKNMRSWYSDFGYERVMSNLKKCYEHWHNSNGKSTWYFQDHFTSGLRWSFPLNNKDGRVRSEKLPRFHRFSYFCVRQNAITGLQSIETWIKQQKFLLPRHFTSL